VGDAKAKEILDFIEIKGTFEETLTAMTTAAGNCPEAEHVSLIYKFMLDAGIQENIVLDPSITRGLDYYTGVVFESFLAEMPEIGSICSGGRYDNLVGLYSDSKLAPLSGVGTSIGLDRLVAALEALGRLGSAASYASVAIACTCEAAGGAYQAVAKSLRNEGIACEVFLDEEKLTKQFQVAEKKGFRWLIIADAENANNPDFLQKSKFTIRDLSKRENRENLSLQEVIKILKQELLNTGKAYD
jgi:histidyl-tRNA synthetase